MNGTKHVHVAPEKMRQGVDQRNNAEAPPVILRVWLKDVESSAGDSFPYLSLGF
jgi:hypothetical protein